MRIRSEVATLMIVAVGGMLGALARWGITGTLPFGVIDTLVVNLVGCALIGLCARRWARRDGLRWSFAITGVLGGFTTFSTFAVDAHILLRVHPWHALAYIVATLCGATAATLIARGRS